VPAIVSAGVVVVNATSAPTSPRDTCRVMSGEPTTPDLVELVREGLDAVNRRDFDALISFYAPDAVWDMREMGVFEGRAAILGFIDDWYRAYEEYQVEAEEILDLGNGVVFAVIVQNATPVGSKGEVRVRQAMIFVWAPGGIVRVTHGTHVNEARAAAERLAEDRG
jgi:ketosteroid isomerase-like protein